MSNVELAGNFQRFTVVGLGMLGGSIAKDLRERFPDAEISAIDPASDNIEQAIQEGVVDKAVTYEKIGRVACFVIIASPLETVVPIAQEVSSAIKSGENNSKRWIVIDTGSVKSDITSTFEALTDEKVDFVSTHPMAGTEFAGYAHSKKHLFRAKPWMVCRHDKNSDRAILATEDFIHSLGGSVREIDAQSHDKQAATSSHSVIMLSNLLFDFVATRHPEALEIAGDGFTSTTRLASGNPRLHEEILKLNQDLTKEILTEFIDYLRSMVGSDLELPADFFAHNKTRRNEWLRKRQ